MLGPVVSPALAACADPTLRTMPFGDAANDAAGVGQWFESISIAGITDYQVDTDGVALADFDRDGRTDILAVYASQNQIKLFLSQGCFDFQEHAIQIIDSAFSTADIGTGAAIPNVIDFNGDGFLDIFLTRTRLLVADPSPGNSLLLSQGAFDVFKDFAVQLGVSNSSAYNRQSSIGDIDGDGYLDIALGADNIGSGVPGLPQQRLYLYQPAQGGVFEDGQFADIGGTSVIPGFGGLFACDPDIDRASPGITLRDLDDDGDLDLVQAYHMDMNPVWGRWDDPCASGEYDSGVYVWRNLLADTGTFQFERVTDNGLADQGKMQYDQVLGYYTTIQPATGLPYVNTADIDNDGLLDVIAVGPTDPEWHVNSDMISGRLWRNDGGFLFSQAKLPQLNWFYTRWQRFWKMNVPPTSSIQTLACAISSQQSLCSGLSSGEHQPYLGDTAFGDFDNDGRIDFILADRREADGAFWDLRNNLFRNKSRRGRFRLIRTARSGIDSNSVGVEVADFNADGLLDLYFNAQPSNSYPESIFLPPLPAERRTDRIYWNTGSRRARKNHWLRVRLSGLSDREAVGAKITLRHSQGPTRDGVLPQMRYLFSNHAYKSSHGLEAHFGLRRHLSVDIEVQLVGGLMVAVSSVAVDRFVDLDINTATVTTVN